MLEQSQIKLNVCVLGAGASGLCAAKFLASNADSFNFTVFERNNSIGGTWIYTENTGNDEYGLPIHTSMYKNVRTNVPKELMSFPDFKKIESDEIGCCVKHEDILKYLNNYANHFNIQQYIKFHTLVKRISLDADSEEFTKWNVLVTDLKNQQTIEMKFDAIMICNGHYSIPYVPKIQGIETFPGTILHSHSYRTPEKFCDQKVVVLGAYVSGIDISIEISQYASVVYLSHNKERLTCELPDNIIQVSGVKNVEKNQITLNDETIIEADSFIYCTGYVYSYPFLDEDCTIKVDDNHVTPLYKHLININYPSMCFIGLGNTVLPFLMFHMQVQYFLSFLKKIFRLPLKRKMLEDIKLDNQRKKYYHRLDSKQWAYYDDLAKEGKFKPIPKFYENGFEIWKVLRGQYPIRSTYYKCILFDDEETVKFTNQCGSAICHKSINNDHFQC